MLLALLLVLLPLNLTFLLEDAAPACFSSARRLARHCFRYWL
jgi:hypothetical protein